MTLWSANLTFDKVAFITHVSLTKMFMIVGITNL